MSTCTLDQNCICVLNFLFDDYQSGFPPGMFEKGGGGGERRGSFPKRKKFRVFNLNA